MEYQTEQHGDPDKILNSKLEREKAYKKRALTTAIMFATIVVFALISLTYGYLQKETAAAKIKLVQASADSLKLMLEQCTHQARMQQVEAEHARILAVEARKHAEEVMKKTH